MIYGYARVSTRGQEMHGNSLDEQRAELEKAGCPSKNIIVEQYTGKTTNRPKFSSLVDTMQAGDTLIVTKLDRFARNVREGCEVAQRILDKGAALNVLNMGTMNNATPQGKLMFHIFLAFAEFERSMIITRTQEGKAQARLKYGKDFKEGRPKKYTKEQRAHAINLLMAGNSYTKVAGVTGISKSTLVRDMRKYKAEHVKE